MNRIVGEGGGAKLVVLGHASGGGVLLCCTVNIAEAREMWGVSDGAFLIAAS